MIPETTAYHMGGPGSCKLWNLRFALLSTRSLLVPLEAAGLLRWYDRLRLVHRVQRLSK